MDIDALELDRNPYGLPAEVIWDLRESELTTGLWPVDTPIGRAVVAVTPSRLVVFGTSGPGARSWNLLHDATVSERALSFHLGQPTDGRTYHLLDPGHADEIAAAAAGAQGGGVRRAQVAGQRLYTRGRAASPDGARRSAKDVVTGYAVLGVILQVLGGIVVAAASAADDPYAGDSGESGDVAFTILGLVITGVGSIFLLIAIAAYGARLALRWREEDRAR